eukprot:scaffold5664_cov115-Isochrysis_galbana.AAC.22
MDKIFTNGPDAAEVYTLAKRAYPGDITWNFDGGFVFGADGQPMGKFSLRGDLAYADRLVRQAARRKASYGLAARGVHMYEALPQQTAASERARHAERYDGSTMLYRANEWGDK